MSMMNAIRGRIAAMYVKFCSGPTPRYTPGAVVLSASSAATVETMLSLERRLSVDPEFDRKKPSGSEMRSLRDQNSPSDREAGKVSAASPPDKG